MILILLISLFFNHTIYACYLYFMTMTLISSADSCEYALLKTYKCKNAVFCCRPPQSRPVTHVPRKWQPFHLHQRQLHPGLYENHCGKVDLATSRWYRLRRAVGGQEYRLFHSNPGMRHWFFDIAILFWTGAVCLLGSKSVTQKANAPFIQCKFQTPKDHPKWMKPTESMSV